MELFSIFDFTNFYCVGAGIGTLMSVSDGIGPYIYGRKIEKTQPLREEKDRKVFSCQSGHFFFIVKTIKVFSLIAP